MDSIPLRVSGQAVGTQASFSLGNWCIPPSQVSRKCPVVLHTMEVLTTIELGDMTSDKSLARKNNVQWLSLLTMSETNNLKNA